MKAISYGHQKIDKDDIREVQHVLRSDYITQGSKVKEFEEALCKYTGAKYAVVVSSGTAALHVACLAAGIKSGDEVITSPMTFAASANCVLYCGGRPVFADIKEDTGNVDPEDIDKKITKRTKAIIPVHFAGHPANLKEIRRIAEKHGLIVIEDAAHALGAEYKGFKIGSCKYSDAAVFSFHPVKSITTGEGGAVLSNNRNLYKKLLMFRNHGITKDGLEAKSEGRWYYEQQYLGFNYRITDFQCALGISQLKKLGKFIRKRREIVQIYNKALSKAAQLELPVEKPYVKSAWHLYPIRLENEFIRKNVFGALRDRGIGVQVHYIPVYMHPWYQRLGYRKGLCKKAEHFYKREISIPIYPAIKDTEIRFVINTLIEVLKRYA